MSCRKAREFLSQQGVEVEERDFFKEPFSEEELRGLLAGRPVLELFATRSPTFKGMGREPSSLSEEEMLGLMLKEPRLIRRPIMQVGGQLVIGFSQKQVEELLGQGKG